MLKKAGRKVRLHPVWDEGFFTVGLHEAAGIVAARWVRGFLLRRSLLSCMGLFQ